MWLIIPKNFEDAKKWRVAEKTLGTLFVEGKVKGIPIGNNGSVLDEFSGKDNWCIVIINRKRKRKLDPKFFCGLEKIQVLIHFGSHNLDTFKSYENVKNLWAKKSKGLGLTEICNTCKVMPISERGGFPWAEKVESFKDAVVCNNVTTDSLKELDGVWEEAGRFFFKIIPNEKLIKALFPLVVDLQTHLSSPMKEEELEASFVSASEALMELEESSDLLEKYHVLEKSVDKLVDNDIEAFLELYRESSKDYTNSQGLSVEGDAA